MAIDPKVLNEIYGGSEALVNPLPTAKAFQPETAAKGIKLSRATGVDALLAAENLPQLEEEQDQLYWDNLVKNSPKLAKQMQEPSFAAIAHDDTENLSDIEKIISKYQHPPQNPPLYDKVKLKDPNGLQAPEQDNWAIALGSKLKQWPEMVRQGMRIAGADFLGNFMNMENTTEDAKTAYQRAVARSKYEDPNLEDNYAGRMAFGALDSVGKMLPATAATIVTRNPLVGVGISTAQYAPTTYADTRMRGGTPLESFANAGIQSAIEVADINPLAFVAKNFGKEAAGSFVKGYLKRAVPTEIAEEIAQGAVDTAIANPNVSWGDYVKSIPDIAVQTTLATLFMGSGLHVANQLASRDKDRVIASEQATVHRETLQQLDEVSRNSQVKARDPETFRQFVASALEDGPVQDVYVDAQVLAQSGVAEQLAQVSPAIATQFEEALQTGGSIRIPFDEYAAQIAGSDFNQQLIDHIKLDADGMTFAESEVFQQQYQEEFNKQIEQSLGKVQGDENFKASANDVKGLLKTQLNQAGHTSPSVNDTYATLASSYYAVRAAAMGITPTELFNRNPLTITGQSVTGESFNQNGIGKALADKISADFTAATNEYANLKDSEGRSTTDGGRILNTDEARELSPEYRADRSRSGDVHEAASKFIKDLYKAKLAQPVAEGRLPFVLFTAGGTGAGKSTSLHLEDGKTLFDSADIIYDTNMNTYDSAVSKIEQALASGRSVGIQYTYRDPVEALVMGALPRAMRMGRTVPLQVHADTHIGVSTTIRKLQEKYREDPRVEFVAVDNSLGKGNQKIVPLETLPIVEDNNLLERLQNELDNQYQTGEITDSVYKGTRSGYSKLQGNIPEDGGGVSAEPQRQNQESSRLSTTRGGFSPSTNTISLLKNADLSTFLHELGHSFLAMDIALAEQIALRGATEAETQILEDMQTVFNWFGLQGELTQQLDAWHALSFEQQRAHHEKLAEGFEAYLFEGQAPNLALQPIFQRFRAWLSNVYRNMMSYLTNAGETLNPEVRAVFDRMIATQDQIDNARQARNMSLLFNSPEEAGMTPEAFHEYARESVQSAQDAITALEAKSLKDMTWVSRLRERTVQRINKDANALRKETRAIVAAEVQDEPVYKALRFLKRGETENDGVISKIEGSKLSLPALKAMYATNDTDSDALTRVLAGEVLVNAKENYRVQKIKDDTFRWSSLPNKPEYPTETLTAAEITARLSAKPSINWQKLGYGQYGALAEDGMHPDLVADMFGFASGDELVRALIDAPPIKDVIEAITDTRMLEQHGEVATPEAVAKAADAAIHNDVRTKIIATELAGLQKALGSARTLSRMAKDYAKQKIGQTKVRDLRPNKFARDAAKAGKLAEEAMRKGDRDMAITQKRNQLVQHATTREAYQSQADATKLLQRFRKIAASKIDNLKGSHNLDLVNATKAILAEFGIGARGQNPRKYLEAVKAYDPELYAAIEADVQQAQDNAKDMKDLTVDELRALSDQVESLWYLARREKQVEIDGKLVDREQVVETLGARLDVLGMPDKVPGEGHAVTEKEKAIRVLLGARAALRRVESWVSRMDGGKITGGFRAYVFTPVSEAADRYRIDVRKYLSAYRDLLKSVEPSLRPGRIAAPEIGYTFGYSKGDAGMSELLHAIAHTGNASNKRKLLLGRGWAVEREDKSLDTSKWDSFIARMVDEGKLTKTHFDFVQGVWDLLEETKPLAQKTHREVFGRYFDEISAESFTTPFGTYRGGYIPALTDTFEVQDAVINQALEDVNAGNAFMFPAASRGFTKSRVEYNRPLALDLRLLPQHIDKVLLFSHMETHVRDVMRTLRAMGGKLTRYDPVAYTDMLLPWLNRAAKQIVQTPSTGTAGKALDKFFSAARSRAGMATMFANVTNTLQQLTGFSIAALKVKPTHLKAAFVQYIKNPTQTAESVAASSTFMNTRLGDQSFELRSEIEDMLINPTKYEEAKAWTSKHAYFMQQAAQNFVDVIAWTGAYNQALAENLNEKDAVRFANSTVRETQGSIKPEDLSRYETGPAWARIFTQFASYFNMQANVLGTSVANVTQEFGIKKGAGQLTFIAFAGFLVPAWVAEAIVQGMRGGGDDDEDDGYLDEFLSFFFGAPLRTTAAMVPIAGPITTRIVAGFTPQQYDDRLASAPAIGAIESAGRAPHSIYKAIADDGSASRAIKDSLTLIAMLTGVPVTAANKPLGYLAGVGQGDIEPTSTLDAVRGTISGAASPDSKR